MNNAPQTLAINIGDSELPYLYYHGRGRVVVMLHATGFLPWLWHPIAIALAGDYRLITPYFCDYRESDPASGLSWMKLAEDLCQMCERLNIASPVMVGHSMGATVITIAEATHSLGAAGMILIEPIFLPQEHYQRHIRVEEHPLAGKSIRRRNFWHDSSAAKTYLRAKEMFKNWDEEFLDLYIQHGMVEQTTGGLRLTCSPEKETSLFMGEMKYNPWPLLPKISCPTLVLEGAKSVNRHLIDLKAAAAEMPHGSYRLVADAGHLIPMEKPKEIIQIITDFLRSL